MQMSGNSLPCAGSKRLFLPDDVSNASKACGAPAQVLELSISEPFASVRMLAAIQGV